MFSSPQKLAMNPVPNPEVKASKIRKPPSGSWSDVDQGRQGKLRPTWPTNPEIVWNT